MSTGELNVLLIEDDDIAAEAVIRGVRRHGLDIPIVIAEDGDVALDILRQQHAERSIDRPYVILLDLNMPRMNGFEFLAELRSDSAISDSVVFVLTTSDNDVDKTRAYQEHVAGYMVKASIGPQFNKLVQLLDDYRSAVEFP